MDLPINKIHRVLLDAGLPSIIEDLQNPTVEFTVNLLRTFLSRFSINISLIDQPTSEQLAVMTYFETSNIISLVNLHTVLTQIFDNIFINDFCVTDITSPGQKRFRRQAKFLANFVLYTMHKKSEFNDRMDKIQATSRLLDEIKEKRAEILESINNRALHKARQLSAIEEVKSNIQSIQTEIGKTSKRKLELETIKNNIEKENQQAKELCASVKTAVGKLSKTIAELQSEVVHSPEKHKTHLNDLEQQKNKKLEERDTMQEAIQDKKQSIKQMEEKLNFMQKINDEMATFQTVDKRLKSQRTQSDNIKKQIELLINTWTELQNKLAMHKDQVDIEMNELESHHKEDIVSLRNVHTQLLSEKKLGKTKLEASKVSFNKKCLERNKLQADIKKKEEEIMALLHSCQEIYDNEIVNELELRKTLGEE